MIRTLRLAIAFGLLAALVVGTGTVAAQSGGQHKVLDKQLIGLAVPGTVVAGVTGAGHAWQIEEGNAKLFSDGRVLVNVEGLVLFPEGTQPAANVRIAVSCNGGATAADIVRPRPVAAFAARGRHALQPVADAAEPVRDTCDLRHQHGRRLVRHHRLGLLSCREEPGHGQVRSDSRTAAGLLSTRRRSTFPAPSR